MNALEERYRIMEFKLPITAVRYELTFLYGTCGCLETPPNYAIHDNLIATLKKVIIHISEKKQKTQMNVFPKMTKQWVTGL